MVLQCACHRRPPLLPIPDGSPSPSGDGVGYLGVAEGLLLLPGCLLLATKRSGTAEGRTRRVSVPEDGGGRLGLGGTPTDPSSRFYATIVHFISKLSWLSLPYQLSGIIAISIEPLMCNTAGSLNQFWMSTPMHGKERFV
ncbi:hypothetical protein SETIT_6G193200v2 [Setaria italica]|uniref:Uncharacterized protein n=1 Tax=Setaria italica TaxID=4555 RepID=A0A368RN93_SETIT|nr:hypothetical protein SETIT_6G193200v2 [Setaria italica]